MIDISGVQEIIGEYLVSGVMDDDDDDDDVSGEYEDLMSGQEFIGRRKRRGKKPSRGMTRSPARNTAMANALAAKQVAGGAIVREHAYTKARVWVLGFDSTTTIAAAASVSITATPQQPFKPKRLSVWGSVASSFMLNNLIIGNQPQFSSLQFGVPADMFGPTAFGTDLDCDTAQANTLVLISATNLSGAALRFIAGIVGPAVS